MSTQELIDGPSFSPEDPTTAPITPSRRRLLGCVAAVLLPLTVTACSGNVPRSTPTSYETHAVDTPTPSPETPRTHTTPTPTPHISIAPPDESDETPSKIDEQCARLASSEATANLEEVLANYLDKWFTKPRETPGGVVVVGCGDRTITSIAFGNKTYEKQDPVTLETKYDVSSVTKLFTTMGILMLHEKGVLDIDEPVGTTLPEYAKGAKAAITLRQLLQHKAGIIDKRYSEIINSSTDPAQIEENILDQPIAKEQIGRYTYSNVGFSVVGIAASRQLGYPLTEAIEALIFKPLGMNNTTYTPSKNCAPTTSDYDSTVYNCKLQDRLGRPLQGNSYHTGVFTTGEDMALFMKEVSKALADKRSLFSHELVTTMCTPSSLGYGTGARINGIVNSSGIKANFGDKMSDKACGHTGWNGAHIAWDPDSRISVGFLANGTYSKHMENRYEDFSSWRRGINNRAVEALAKAIEATKR